MATNKHKVLIQISGGMLYSVVSTADVEVVIVDWDKIAEGDALDVSPRTTDDVVEKLSDSALPPELVLKLRERNM